MASASVVSRKLRVSHRRYLSMTILLGAFLILVRLYDMIVVANLSGYPSGSWISQIYGLGYDFLLCLRISLWMIIPLIAIGYYSRLWQKVVFTLVVMVVILSELALVQYFSVTRVPLGADVLAHSYSEMWQTISQSGQMSFGRILSLVLFAVAIPLAFFLIRTITLNNFLKRTLTILIILSLFLGGLMNPYPEDYKDEFQQYVASNKLSFLKESVDNYRDYKAETEVNLSIEK